MNLHDVLLMLLGAALVAVGVLAAAIADRLRGLRVTREAAPRERPIRAQVPLATVVEPARTRPSRAATEGGEDVIAALVASGYKRPAATEATWACTAAERATVEGWTASALRRCARGGMS
jgi:hypothetical protein